MPGDLIFAIIMLIACLGMMSWMLYEFFTKIKSENLLGGLVFWIAIFFFGAVICGARIAAWY